MKGIDVAWLAGWLEGEGCFDTTGTGGTSPRIQAMSTDLDVLLRVQSIVGSGKVTANKLIPGKKQTWRWNICGRRAVEIMMEVRPYMSLRRGEKIDALVERFPLDGLWGNAKRSASLIGHESFRKKKPERATPLQLELLGVEHARN